MSSDCAPTTSFGLPNQPHRSQPGYRTTNRRPSESNQQHQDSSRRTIPPELDAIFRFVQLHHHYEIWEKSIPRGIKDNIDNVTMNINPPRPNTNLYSRLGGINERFTREIMDTVKQHLQDEIEGNIDILQRMVRPSNSSDLINKVRTLCSNRMGKRLRIPFRDHHIREALFVLQRPLYRQRHFPTHIGLYL